MFVFHVVLLCWWPVPSLAMKELGITLYKFVFSTHGCTPQSSGFLIHKHTNHSSLFPVLPLSLMTDLCLYSFSDGKLTGPLTDLSQVCSGETLCYPGQIRQVYVLRWTQRNTRLEGGFMWRCVCICVCVNDLSDWRLAEVGPQDGRAGAHVRERDVNQLIQATRSQDCRIYDVRPRATDRIRLFLTWSTVRKFFFYLLVAPMIKTFFLSLIPSISVKIWLMTLSAAPPASPAPPPRDLAMESSSSKNRMHGAACRACYHDNTSNMWYSFNSLNTLILSKWGSECFVSGTLKPLFELTG